MTTRTSSNGPTDHLCQQVGQLAIDHLSEETRLRARQAAMDGIGVMLAGCRHDVISLLADHTRALGGAPRCPVYGHGFATDPIAAAFVNGNAMHILDFEPMFHPPTHPLSPVLPALLALAEFEPDHQDGGRLLASLVMGIELQGRLREIAATGDGVAVANRHHFPFDARGYHPPGVVGVMGSALACGHFLGLEPPQLATALGIAASRAAGIAGNIGTMTKASHSGHAARMGVESALLARAGVTASQSIFEAPSGFAQVFGDGAYDLDRLTRDFTDPRALIQPGIAHKRWPAHTAMQVAIQAGLALHEPGHVPRSIEIRSPCLPYCDRPAPHSSNAARFSFQYAVAVAVLDGSVGPDSFTESRRQEPILQALLRQTRNTGDPDIPTPFPEMWVEVSVDGSPPHRAETWPGHWRQPMTSRDLDEKFRACTAGVLSDDAAQHAHDGLKRIEEPGMLAQVLASLRTI